jgi:Tol biopolymer transport system component
MSHKNNASILSAFLLAIASLAGGAAIAQVSEEERAATEEAQRQINIARTFAANARQLTAYSIDGRELGKIGEPELYNFPQFSPDLTQIATVKFDLQEESADVWVLDVESGEPKRISFSKPRERVQTPVWSADSSELVYVGLRGSRFGIYRARADGTGETELIYDHEGGPIVLADWSLDGRFLAFSESDLSGGRIFTLDLEGDRQPKLVFQWDSMSTGPRFSPDRRYLSFVSDKTGRIEYYVTPAEPVGGPAHEPIQMTTEGGFGLGAWDADEPKFYYLAQERKVIAYDVDTAGDFKFSNPTHVFTVPEAVPAGGGGGLVTISRNGERLIFALPPKQELFQIAVLDRAGKVLSRIGEPDRYFQPSFSPDGSKVVAIRTGNQTGESDIWTFDVATGQGTQVTTTVDIDEDSPVFMSDGEHVAYSYFHEDYSWIHRKAADGSGDQELLFRYTPGAFLSLMDVSAGDEYLLFESFGFVVTAPLKGDDALAREGIDLLREEFEVSMPRFSPDMSLVAYTYNDTGRPEVHLTGFDKTTGMAVDGPRHKVSSDGTVGGIAWREDGRELYYISENKDTDELNDVKVMAVAVTTQPELRTEAPRVLFEITLPTAGDPSQWQNVSPDGQRFLFALPTP